jgi:hypothetical protein
MHGYCLTLWCVYPLLGNDLVNTFPRKETSNNRTSTATQRISEHASITIEAVFSAWYVQSGYKEGFSWEELLSEVETVQLKKSSFCLSRDGSLRWLRRNGKKGIRLWKGDFMRNLKWQLNCYTSVAWIRIVKAQNPSACSTMNCKVCGIAIALY